MFAPAPAVTFVVPSQQLPPVYTHENGHYWRQLRYAQFGVPAIFHHCSGGSLPPVEEFTEPVYDQVHQEQFAAGEMTENMVDIPVVQEQVIVSGNS